MARVRNLIILMAGAVGLAVLLSACEPAQSFVVTTTADVVDAVPGDGVCDDGSGNCSLRGAIQEANALPGLTQIDLGEGETYTLSIPGADEDEGATGDLDVTGALLLAGKGATVDGAGLDRVLDVHEGGALIVGNVTITGGVVDVAAPQPAAANEPTDGPATHEGTYTLLGGGGIRSDGSLALGGVTVTDNRVSVNGQDLIAVGGGVWAGSVQVHGSEISANSLSATVEPAAYAAGAGLYADTSATIDRSTVVGNSASGQSVVGGGVTVTGLDGHPAAQLSLSRTTVAENMIDSESAAAGGGVFADSGSITDTHIHDNDVGAAPSQPFQFGGGAAVGPGTTITDTTVERNTAGGAAGVMGYFMYSSDGGHIALDRVTVRSNIANAGAGGGVVLQGGGNNLTTMSIDHSTIADNEALEVGGLGGYSSSAGTPSLFVSDTTISGNVAHDDDGTYFNAGRAGGVRLSQIWAVLSHMTVTANTAETVAGGIQVDGSRLDLRNTVVGGQTAGADCLLNGTTGAIISLGYNADSDGSCTLTEPTDQPMVAPALGPLADNGGPTWTHLPLAGSPLLDVIPFDVNGCGTAPDQRGVPRPQGPACDVGSVER